MLAALSIQLIDSLDFKSLNKESIELSESESDIEEDDLFEATIYVLFGKETIFKKPTRWYPNEQPHSRIIATHIKPFSPPPELA